MPYLRNYYNSAYCPNIITDRHEIGYSYRIAVSVHRFAILPPFRHADAPRFGNAAPCHGLLAPFPCLSPTRWPPRVAQQGRKRAAPLSPLTYEPDFATVTAMYEAQSLAGTAARGLGRSGELSPAKAARLAALASRSSCAQGTLRHRVRMPPPGSTVTWVKV